MSEKGKGRVGASSSSGSPPQGEAERVEPTVLSLSNEQAQIETWVFAKTLQRRTAHLSAEERFTLANLFDTALRRGIDFDVRRADIKEEGAGEKKKRKKS